MESMRGPPTASSRSSTRCRTGATERTCTACCRRCTARASMQIAHVTGEAWTPKNLADATERALAAQ
ncbi:MAG: hypothetical protein MZW92_24635 [Comamonadaceae bacterium]|nr:hypothetical protein [Comamonadaceae bacterium]